MPQRLAASRRFTAEATKHLVFAIGSFDVESNANAWNHYFRVPGPGVYTITTGLLIAGKMSKARQTSFTLTERTIVSIGDSAASGEGNPDRRGVPEGFDPDLPPWKIVLFPVGIYELTKELLDWSWETLKRKATTISRLAGLTLDLDPPAVWLEPAAHRSLLSGHARGAAMLERLGQGEVVRFFPFARSGSTIEDGLLGPRTSFPDRWIGNRGQIQEVADVLGSRRIDALLIYIGVNDLGFSGRLKDLTSDGIPIPGQPPEWRAIASIAGTPNDRARIDKEVDAILRKISDKFDRLADAITVLNVRHVYLTEYPAPLFDGDGKSPKAGCGLFELGSIGLSIDQSDAAFIEDLGEKLNLRLKAEARRLGWKWIGGIANSFSGHGYCSSNPYFVSGEESLATQGDTEGTVHPNERGHWQIGRRVEASVRAGTFSVPETTTGGTAGPVRRTSATTVGR